MKGNSVLSAVLSNLSMHGFRPAWPFGLLPQWIRKTTVPLRSRHLSEVLKMIGKHSPDILCLNEILIDLQQAELDKQLRQAGFTTIVYGVCRHHQAPFRISLVLATKTSAQEIPFNLTMAPRPGGAGGAASLYVSSENLAILGVHLALPGPVMDQELTEVNTWIQDQKELGRRMLVIGDFNLEKAQLDRKVPALASFRETAFPTCPSFPTFLKRQECIDHIFFDKGFTPTDAGVEQGLSDHKLAWAEGIL